MNRQLRILALIPARGGSKRLPNKNKLLLGDRPLIVWSIEAAKGVSEICDILVSTDDPEIAEISREAGGMVPWIRPSQLATDKATSIEVALHALDWYEGNRGEVDGLLLLQPTSPFRNKIQISRAISLFSNNPIYPVISVSPTHAHPLWTLRMDGELCVPYFKDHGLNKRSQELTLAYAVNGSIYLCSPKQMREKRSFVAERNTPLIINSHIESLDIDTHDDFDLARCLLQYEQT